MKSNKNNPNVIFQTPKSTPFSYLYIVCLCLFLLALPLALTHCSASTPKDDHSTEAKAQADAHGHEEEGEHHEEEGGVHITPEEAKEFGITTAIAGPASLFQEIQLTGEIVIDPHRIAHIKPRFAGVVKQVFKYTGDRVKKGETLAIIESNESLSQYKLNAAINGTVIAMHMTLGENMDNDEHVITVADLSLVWANLTLYQKDLGQIRVGQTVFIRSGDSSEEFQGRIAYISPLLDEKTRTATARIELANPQGLWKPGMFVTARVQVGETQVPLAVDKNAIIMMNEQAVVFVRDNEDFRPCFVSLGLASGPLVEIRAGLTPGQEIAVSGALMIKAELQKNAFGDPHNH